MRNRIGETSSRCSLAPNTTNHKTTETTAAMIESVRHARLGTALDAGWERRGPSEGMAYTAEGVLVRRLPPARTSRTSSLTCSARVIVH